MIKIKSIEVEKLFGRYSYELLDPQKGNFMILYGDNGCGKTTILSCIFHLLNPERRNSHRRSLAKVVFEKIIVKLSNGDCIYAIKENSLGESVLIRVCQGKKTFVECKYFYEKNYEMDVDLYENNEKYCQYLDKLDLNMLYLSADRKIYEDEYRDDDYEFSRSYRNDSQRILKKNKKVPDLNTVLDDFRGWLITSVVEKTNVGYGSIEELYLGVIKNYEKKESDIKNIKEDIDKLYEDNEKFRKFGLSKNFLSDVFRDKLKKMTKKTLDKITPVLEPYINSLELRLQALQTIQEKLEVLKRYLDAFFIDKEVKIDAFDGLKIYSDIDKKELNVKDLSSGERQIIYLFCRIVVASAKSSIVIIDEPEISLNIKWQKQFLRAINDIIGENNDEKIDDGSVQVIIASHSIDLISPYDSSVVLMKKKV